MRSYKCLKEQEVAKNNYKIVPIRDKDKELIREWRNEQMYHLRQNEVLTKEKQHWYFENIVANLFEQEKPNLLLFSYLENDNCIGYGGLVHINWSDKNAEISFIMKTDLEENSFDFHWSNYLEILEKIAFQALNLHKIYAYSFEVRPHLYPMLLKNKYQEEARLKGHCFFDNKFIDVLIHSKWNGNNV